MILKIFLFQFVNSYSSFYYVAFAARYAGDCEASVCLQSLATNLATLYITQVVVGNTLELLLPYLGYKYKYHFYIKKNVNKISRPEIEYLLEPVNKKFHLKLLMFNLECIISMTSWIPVLKIIPKL